MSHTESLRPLYVKINGRLASEFMLFSYAAALEKVPTVFLSGDKQLCEDSKDLHPGLITCPVKEGFGEAIVHENPANTLKSIKSGVCQALDQHKEHGLPVLPDRFELEICYKDHVKAEKFSYFPGVERVNDNTIRFRTDDYFELLRVFSFVN